MSHQVHADEQRALTFVLCDAHERTVHNNEVWCEGHVRFAGLCWKHMDGPNFCPL